MTLATPTNDLAAKTLLARLMATEDITVEQRADAKTASFNMATRTLTLPVWKDMAGDTLDMLIGHEVSHALYTPAGAEPLTKACEYIDPNNLAAAKDYINVVEDARIERLIKRDYQGLRRCFANGYRALHATDIFGIKDAKVADLPLIDRINLHYKIGWLIEVPFSAAELPLAQEVAKTSSWSEVVDLSKRLYDLAKQQQQEQEQDEQESGEGESAETPEDQQDSDDSKQQQQQQQQASSTDKGNDKSDKKKSQSQQQSQDGAESDETDADGETQNKNEGDEDGKTTEGSVPSTDAPKQGAPRSRTMEAQNKGLEEMVDKTAIGNLYADIPNPLMDRFVIDLRQTMESLRGWKVSRNLQVPVTACYNSWKSINSGAVQVLATEFERRKAADAHKRTAIAETGSLDPNRLHAYRIAEDIFLQNAYVKDGKNHGIILLLDMSGSMQDVFHDTMVQLVTLAHFCRRVNIPFRFYGFTDRSERGWSKSNNTKYGYTVSDATFPSCVFTGGEGEEGGIRTRLVTLLTDGMRNADFMDQCGMLLYASMSQTRSSKIEDHPSYKAIKAVGFGIMGCPSWMSLDGTPTNAAMLGLPSVIREFKNAKRVQVCNVIVLTDGEATDNIVRLAQLSKEAAAAGGRNEQGFAVTPNIIWRDRETRKTYTTHTMGRYGRNTYSAMEQTAILNQIVKDRTGANVICIHLASARDAKSVIGTMTMKGMDSKKSYAQKEIAIEKAMKTFKDTGFAMARKYNGYDAYIVMRHATSEEAGEIDGDINDKGGLRKIRSSFSKALASQKTNRPLLVQVADILSKGVVMK